jgi:hypothetical protein
MPNGWVNQPPPDLCELLVVASYRFAWIIKNFGNYFSRKENQNGSTYPQDDAIDVRWMMLLPML